MMERSYKTEKEVREKLLTKEFSEKSIQKAIEFLKEYNFINDEKYAQMYIKDKIKLSGKNKIKYSLIRKGVDEEFIKSNLDMVDKDSELEVAEKLAYKKYAVISKGESDKYKLSNKLIRFLMTKGYDYDTCKKVTKKIVELDFND
jgi:regulatory protein